MRTIYAVRLIHWTEQRSDYRSFGVYESNIMMPPGLLKVGMYSNMREVVWFIKTRGVFPGKDHRGS